jgi:hypothetical protein
MKIRFLKDCVLEVCVGLDEYEEPIMVKDEITKGEAFEVNTCLDDEIVEIQFGDGSLAFVNKELFEVIEE